MDGEDYKLDCKESETVEQAWDRCNNLGSKWFFYPICFVIVDHGYSIYHLNKRKQQRIIDTPHMLGLLQGKSVKTAMSFIAENGDFVKMVLTA
jgi:hypothetical protein